MFIELEMENKQTHATVGFRYVETLQSVTNWKEGMYLSLFFNIRTDNCADSEDDPHQTRCFTYKSRIEKLDDWIKHIKKWMECCVSKVF